MEQTGEYRIDAPRVVVWQALNDPDVLARCIEGCEKLVRIDDDRYHAVIKARVGSLRATFHAQLDVTDIDVPESYRLNAEVDGGPAGFGKGSADVRLRDANGATHLDYVISVSRDGKLAEVGNRLVEGTLRKRADDFFSRFGEVVAPEGAEPIPGPAAVPAPPAPTAAIDSGRDEAKERWRTWAIVAIALASSIFVAMMVL